MEPKALLIDARLASRAAVAGDLAAAGFEVIEARDGLDGWQKFRRRHPDLVLSDLRVPRSGGMQLLRRIRSVSSTPVILFAASGDAGIAAVAIKEGAQEFFTLPDDRRRMIERAGEIARSLASRQSPDGLDTRIVGCSPAARRLRDRVRALAPLRVPVLVTGEVGVGRDHTVRCLHELSEPGSDRLVRVDPASAGARQHRSAAAFHLADIGRFAPADQVYWFERLRGQGSHQPVPPRIFASSSDDLAMRARQGGFHPLLARRLLRFRVHVVPLRERSEDIEPLIHHHALRVGREMGRPEVRFDRSAIARLTARSWPGNVAELVTAVERLVAFSPRGEVTGDLASEVLGESANGVASLRRQRDERLQVELVEALEQCGGNLAGVARRLGISRGAVIYRAQKFGLLPRSS